MNEDKYLIWLEDQIAKVIEAKQVYSSMKKLSRDIEKILETLLACKSKYLKCLEEEILNE